MAPAVAEPAQEAEEAKECLWASCAHILFLPSSFSFSPTIPAPSSLHTSHSSIPDNPSAIFQRLRARTGFWHPELFVRGSCPAFFWSSWAESVSGHPGEAVRQGFILTKSALCHPQRSTGSPRLIFAMKKGKNSSSTNTAMQAGVPTPGQLWKIMWISDCIN